MGFVVCRLYYVKEKRRNSMAGLHEKPAAERARG